MSVTQEASTVVGKDSTRTSAPVLGGIDQRAIATYTKPGDLVLDPMAGIGSTLVEAVHLGRDAIGVEYEPQWADLGRANIAYARSQGATGHGDVVCGDARHGTSVVDPAGGDLVALVLTSPPCGPSLHGRITARPGQGIAKAHHQYSTDLANMAHVGLAGLLDDADHPCRLRLPAPPGRCRGAVPPRPGLRPTAATRRGTGPSNSELQPADSRICQGLTLRCAWRSPPTSTISGHPPLPSSLPDAPRRVRHSGVCPRRPRRKRHSRAVQAWPDGQGPPGEWVIYLPDRHVCPRDIVAGCEHERGRRVGWVPDPASAVLYERWRLVGPPEPPCGGRLQSTVRCGRYGGSW